MKKYILKTAAFALCFVLLLSLFTVLLIPKPTAEIAVDSNFHLGFYELEEQSLDVLILGSSHSFCSVSPMDLFHDYGMTSYIRGSSCQKIWSSYYLLRDSFRSQTPKVVALEVMMLFDTNVQHEPYNREIGDYLEPSPVLLEVAQDSARRNPEESIASYLFPILRYHDRWKSLEQKDFDFFFAEKEMLTKGFLPRISINPVAEYDLQNDALDVEPAVVPEESVQYIQMIQQLCQENGAQLLLFKAPTRFSTFWGGARSLGAAQMAQELEIPFYDFNYGEWAVNINWEKDALDGGNHINYTGAMKVTPVLGNILKSNYNLPDKRTLPEYNSWNEDYSEFIHCVDMAYQEYLGMDAQGALAASYETVE